MNATVTKTHGYRLSRTELRRRWQLLASDPLVAAIPGKIELNEKGAIEVSPPTVRHGVIQAFVTRELARQRPEGTTITECPVETEIGVRVPDVVWASPEFMARHGGESTFQIGPDLCVEVLSPTNTPAEIDQNLALTPENTLSLWTTFELPWRIGVGGGAQFMDNVFRNAANTAAVPSYWLINATASYEVNSHLTLRLNSTNLADVDYIDRVGGGHYIPGPGRQVLLTATVKR